MKWPEFMLWDGIDSNACGWIFTSVYEAQSSFERIIWEDMMRRYRGRR
jgi:hypothetical protein